MIMHNIDLKIFDLFDLEVLIQMIPQIAHQIASKNLTYNEQECSLLGIFCS